MVFFEHFLKSFIDLGILEISDSVAIASFNEFVFHLLALFSHGFLHAVHDFSLVLRGSVSKPVLEVVHIHANKPTSIVFLFALFFVCARKIISRLSVELLDKVGVNEFTVIRLIFIMLLNSILLVSFVLKHAMRHQADCATKKDCSEYNQGQARCHDKFAVRERVINT